ncbi:uncharacterized protein LOC133194962 [Saccostrea echinata]|uniref:uncharacterized protein LOC133194962 n=1 Tax=Saccostrea echinata TaxID=191078 RepID=UPI002A82727B|nr:uncharacterized protein LOC133194962 [Saccostrea echinata]
MGTCAKFENETDYTCRLVDCDGEVSQWSTDDLKQYCILKDASHISCLEVSLLYRVIACNVPGSYGYSNDIFPAAIWVRNDCYAQFKVCYKTDNMKKLSNDLNNPWSSILMNNKNETENLYGNITHNQSTPYNKFTKIRYSTNFPIIPRPPRQKPWKSKIKRKPSSAENSDTDATENVLAVSKLPETTTKSVQVNNTTVSSTKQTTKANLKTTKATHPSTSPENTSVNNPRPESEANNTLQEKNLYFMNSGVIHAGEIDIDVNGRIKHHHLSNDTADEFEVSTPHGGGSSLSGSEFLFGAVFGIAFLVLVLLGLVLFICRAKIKRCVHGKDENTGTTEQERDRDISFISGPITAEYPGHRPRPNANVGTVIRNTNPLHNQFNQVNPGFNQPLPNNQYFILQPESHSNTPRHHRNLHNTNTEYEDEGSHKYFVLENFPSELSCPKDKDDYDNAVPHPCYGGVSTLPDEHPPESNSVDTEGEILRAAGYRRIGDTKRQVLDRRVSQV